MFSWIKGLFKPRTLSEYLYTTKKVKYKGIIFVIKKIDPMDYLEGQKVMISTYQTYEDKRKSPSESSMKKVKGHITDVIMAGVVKPALSRKEEEGKIHVDEIFRDWDLAGYLYDEILCLTYGKKKVKKSQRDTSQSLL